MKDLNPIWKILEDAGNATGDDAKLEVLLKEDCMPLRLVLRAIYDKDQKCLLPPTTPPYKPNPLEFNHGMMRSEARRLRIFFEGNGYDNLTQHRREILFIQMLESVHYNDAKVLESVCTRKRLKGILPRVATKYLEMTKDT